VKSVLYTGGLEARFDFEIITSPDPCLRAIVSTTSINNMSYKMQYSSTITINTFNRLTYSINPVIDCGPILYSITPSNVALLTYLKVGGSTHALVPQPGKLGFTDTTLTVIRLEFGNPSDHNLLGIHNLIMKATLKTFPFAASDVYFTLTLTSACSELIIVKPYISNMIWTMQPTATLISPETQDITATEN
jgi:hypothetical protein